MTLNLETETEALTTMRGVSVLQSKYNEEFKQAFAIPTFMEKFERWILESFGIVKEASTVAPVTIAPAVANNSTILS